MVYKRLVDTFIYLCINLTNKTKRSIKIKTLEKISKSETNYLILKNILTQKHGNYGENLIVIGKFSSRLRKQRYCTPPVYNALLSLKSREIVDLDRVKENQKYLFSGSSVVNNSECVS